MSLSASLLAMSLFAPPPCQKNSRLRHCIHVTWKTLRGTEVGVDGKQRTQRNVLHVQRSAEQ